ncbi:glutathione peroxidase [Rhodobacter aestuarii]|uniref:Glutathione peroxidase n=1 Tax=Rhodobacter aestuarii TaxID=453582 RepID=A0A1N7N938_9RHOB|nr:glutathione peroxidase [Rhodobacter aestuarii]PTV96312.1 glutathione peroxidase [Rhodobacter aestuarii]SIS94874.1 glutathione peroxidase [Rhodobacter aestuarii]
MKFKTMALALFTGFGALGASGNATSAAEPPSFTFASIEGDTIDTADFRGHPVLVVNTASLCGFTPQLEGLQKLHEEYGPKGLVVLAVPSDDFKQELDSAKEVSEFCTLTYGITLPMADITHVTGDDAHPFYKWVREQTGFAPRWNFNKVLIDGQGNVVDTWGSMTKPESGDIRRAFEPLLPGA